MLHSRTMRPSLSSVRRRLLPLAPLGLTAVAVACSASSGGSETPPLAGQHDAGDGDVSALVDAPGEVGALLDATGEPPPFDPDSGCASATEEAKPVPLPVDIIWMI